MSSKIKILPDRVANQIAAGEVIERPAAVVKELVENALDAGATRLEVEFRHGGRSLMRIEDNGAGMSRDDALLALERHATSKIAAAADLDSLSSFGFRGEALPSIASVSEFSIQTREASSDTGTEVFVNGGKLVHVRECGRAVGTRIEVKHLFNSVPARRKFLKSDATESAHIIQGVRLYALAFPHVAFTLIEDGRVIFRSPQCETLRERVAGIFGKQIAENLIPIDAAEGGMRISGLIDRPGSGMGRATRHEMITYINRRPVDSRALNYALIESYTEHLPKGRYPVAFVFFEIDPAAVDVNVHPAKREVRFRNETAVRGFVIRNVLDALRNAQGGLGGSSGTGDPPVGLGGMAGTAAQTPPTFAPTPRVTPQVQTHGRVAHATQPIQSAGHTGGSPVPPNPPEPRPIENRKPEIGNSTWRFLGLAHQAYALFETSAGLVVLDRRSAHERIWFERLQTQFRSGEVPSQRLLLPIPIELDAIASALLLDRLDFFNKHGFEITEFGRNFFRVESVPAWMEPADAEPFVRDLLGALRDGRLQEKNIDLARDELARLAVVKAIRLPAAASEAEMRAMIGQLLACKTPLTSPAGRPTYFELSLGELARRFGR
ncbi:DNA mismatch repair protein MutL [Ereboglobus sp. PH5-5]|uniref:DNA mismatch repair endonuclease MutL n=1 Tax=Ereboglobus sp. PH5-5 TaxID=2940529 RepID=UPI002404DD2A|nr:DNA mismatch repair endonuclease MutL [Ereboglobus sp. PH5-5]MDF9832908.1 DNA mismatch repair protein MutL [Ereboglobus sp. PH5-5]